MSLALEVLHCVLGFLLLKCAENIDAALITKISLFNCIALHDRNEQQIRIDQGLKFLCY